MYLPNPSTFEKVVYLRSISVYAYVLEYRRHLCTMGWGRKDNEGAVGIR
jgi:hypothetical protein